MATLEKRSGSYRVIFYFGGQRFAHSLKTANQRQALASLARLDDNLGRVELGLLAPPEGADLASFLLSDGRALEKPAAPTIRTLHELFRNYFDSIPADVMEATTRRGHGDPRTTSRACPRQESTRSGARGGGPAAVHRTAGQGSRSARTIDQRCDLRHLLRSMRDFVRSTGMIVLAREAVSKGVLP